MYISAITTRHKSSNVYGIGGDMLILFSLFHFYISILLNVYEISMRKYRVIDNI